MRVVVRVPALPAVTQALPATITGPFLAWCRNSWPTGDDTAYLFGLYGLGSGNVVTWTYSLGVLDEISGPENRQVLMVLCKGGSGSVTATVDGTEIGTIEYAPGGCIE